MKLFRKSIFLSVCHPERSEVPYAGYNTLKRDRSVVIRSFAALRMTDFLTFQTASNIKIDLSFSQATRFNTFFTRNVSLCIRRITCS